MTWFVKAKHWQIFLLMIGLPFFCQILLMIVMIITQNPFNMLWAFPIVVLLSASIHFCWYYSVGTLLHKKLPKEANVSISKFRFFVLFPFIYFIVFLGLFVYIFFHVQREDFDPFSIFKVFLFIIPFHLFAIFCLFYNMWFIARTLKMVEWWRPVTFSDYILDIVLLWFFIVGIWFIQPRINKLFPELQ